MRWQKNQLSGSRPEDLEHPRASLHTAESYYTKYMISTPRQGGNASVNRLFRLQRLQRRDARIAAAQLAQEAIELAEAQDEAPSREAVENA